ncbi:conserved hypothetical protein [Ricinus communis]|uniref:Uncharacterized protein n=1 Tax=Ricinus communis TaxID=3988 RepID=B9S1C4_RICCO|nr:conserved hypothetical protein [Ricinus communis]
MHNGDGIAVGWLGHPIFRERRSQSWKRTKFYLPRILECTNDEVDPQDRWNLRLSIKSSSNSGKGEYQ